MYQALAISIMAQTVTTREMFIPHPSLAVVKFWQGLVEVVLRVFAIVSVTQIVYVFTHDYYMYSPFVLKRGKYLYTSRYMYLNFCLKQNDKICQASQY